MARREMTLDEAAEWFAWDQERCGAEAASMRNWQEERSRGGDPRRWLIPDELVDDYRADDLTHAVFDAAAHALLSNDRPPASAASREAVLVRLASMLIQDRHRLMEEISKLHREGLPPVIITRG